MSGTRQSLIRGTLLMRQRDLGQRVLHRPQGDREAGRAWYPVSAGARAGVLAPDTSANSAGRA